MAGRRQEAEKRSCRYAEVDRVVEPRFYRQKFYRQRFTAAAAGYTIPKICETPCRDGCAGAFAPVGVPQTSCQEQGSKTVGRIRIPAFRGEQSAVLPALQQ